MGRVMIAAASLYFVVGVLIGMGMSMTESFVLSSVHAHINLLGWVSLALGGILYHLFPAAEKSRLGVVHGWLHLIGIPIMMIGLTAMMLTGNHALAAIVAVGGVMIVLGTILFSINCLLHIGRRSAGKEGSRA